MCGILRFFIFILFLSSQIDLRFEGAYFLLPTLLLLLQLLLTLDRLLVVGTLNDASLGGYPCRDSIDLGFECHVFINFRGHDLLFYFLLDFVYVV